MRPLAMSNSPATLKLLHHWNGAVSVNDMVSLIIMIIAVVVDLGAWGGGHRHYRSRWA